MEKQEFLEEIKKGLNMIESKAIKDEKQRIIDITEYLINEINVITETYEEETEIKHQQYILRDLLDRITK